MSTAPQSAHDRFRHWATRMIAHHYGGARELYQSSTMGALLDGVYDGDVTIAEILRHGL